MQTEDFFYLISNTLSILSLLEVGLLYVLKLVNGH